MKTLQEYIKALVDAKILKEGVNAGVAKQMFYNAIPLATENILIALVKKQEEQDKRMAIIEFNAKELAKYVNEDMKKVEFIMNKGGIAKGGLVTKTIKMM